MKKEYTHIDITRIFIKCYNDRRSKLHKIIDIEDFIQECWIKLLKSNFDPVRSSYSTFSYIVANSVASNTVKSFFRNKNRIRRETFNPPIPLTDSSYNPTRQYHEEEILNSFITVSNEINIKRIIGRSVNITGGDILKILYYGGNIDDIVNYSRNNNCDLINKRHVSIIIKEIKKKLKESLRD